MKTYTQEVGEQLNELLEKTYDAERGFKKASDNVTDGNLKKYFLSKAQERYDFGHALKTEIKKFGQEVEKGDSIVSKVHRSWMDLKSIFSLDKEESMLEEAIKGEKNAIETYNDVLNNTSLPASTANLLKDQRSKIRLGLQNIKTLEDIA